MIIWKKKIVNVIKMKFQTIQHRQHKKNICIICTSEKSNHVVWLLEFPPTMMFLLLVAALPKHTVCFQNLMKQANHQ